ncbi:putative tRNA(His) guanylyltransferase [Morus notabilis]|uniref:tRNA(His) guanylyltransferase n=1 Tax=Morus notabilis TaxID=981085 RepID=W9SUQ3_9ROSA|nr:putative tRNA(His) guanylyltransferase [Morus notabilis]
MDDLRIKWEGPMRLYCDNKSAINIAHNPVQHDRTKHIEIDRYFIKEKLEEGLICMSYVSSGSQLADVLTKGLNSSIFHEITFKLGMEDIYFPAWGGVFSEVHEFIKPNDERALNLMNSCAVAVLKEFRDIVFAYGVSDEYSFIVKKDSQFYQRRASDIVTTVASFFASMYVINWQEFFQQKELKYLPSFDGRAVCYPSSEILRDYLAWRQVDCHINNQYNTCFWELVKSGKGKSEAQHYLKGTQSAEKNELLKQFGILDYNTLPVMFRQGSSVFWDKSMLLLRSTLRKGRPGKARVGHPEWAAVDVGVGSVVNFENSFSKDLKSTVKIEIQYLADFGGSVLESGGEDNVLKHEEELSTETSPKKVVARHCNIIEESFWRSHPSILNEKREIL